MIDPPFTSNDDTVNIYVDDVNIWKRPVLPWRKTMKIRVPRKPANAYQHGNLREALVQAGLKLLSEGGVENLSLRARRPAGRGQPRRALPAFPDKEALVAAIKEEGFRLLAASLEAAEAARARSGGARAAAGAGPGLRELRARAPGLPAGDLRGRAAGSEGHRGPAAGRAAGLPLLRDLVAEGIERGELRPGDPDLLSLASWSLVHGLSHLLINRAVEPPGGSAAVDQLTEALLQLLGEGIDRPGGR